MDPQRKIAEVRNIMSQFFVLESVVLGLLVQLHPSFAATCTITEYNTENIKDAEANCAELILDGISVPAGKTLDINLNQGAKLIFQGTLTWEFYEWDGPLVNITGTDVEIFGTKDHVLDGRGRLWWDGKGGGGGKIKPIFFVAHGLKNAILRNITIKNPPNHAIWIEDSNGVVAQDIYVDSKDGDTLGGHNTDGINVWRSDGITIQRLTVYNQDDCVAVKSGTNVLVTDAYCFGGHGLSIGSVGGRDYNIVENVLVSNSEIVESVNGVRIKTVYGATGSVTNVTYENILLKDITKFGIVIEGDYNIDTGSPTGNATDGVPITDFTVKNVTGTVKSSGVNIYILVKKAADWHWSEVSVIGGEKTKKCEGIPEGAGVTC